MKSIVEFSDRKQIIDEAASWVLKLESDRGLTPVQREELCQWLDGNPSRREHFERLAKVWGNANILTELAVPLPRSSSLAERWSELNFSAQFIAIAASLFLAIAVAGTVFFEQWREIQANGVIVTQVGEQKSIDLADGSVLKLNTNSKAKIDYTADSRNIYLLNGEAHFIVEKNKERPFRVYAGTGRIHAIGTAFSVYLQNDKVDVTVSEGRVGVAALVSTELDEDNSSSSAGHVSIEQPLKSLGLLRAGEAGSIVSQLDENDHETPQLDRYDDMTNLDVAKRVSWINGVLIFAGEPLEEVVREISRYTEVSIEFSDPELKKIRIGGNFPVGETETMFSSLETSFGLKVTRLDSNRVVISGAKKFN